VRGEGGLDAGVRGLGDETSGGVAVILVGRVAGGGTCGSERESDEADEEESEWSHGPTLGGGPNEPLTAR
jgi:hypothetical protein